MFGSLGSRSGRRRLRFKEGLSEDGGIIAPDAGRVWEPGDFKLSFDESPPGDDWVEMDGSTITDGALDNPGVAARYPWMVSGSDLELSDMRGGFMRIWANGSTWDPDRASRSARAGDGQTGDYPGTWQSDDYKAHAHNYSFAQHTTPYTSGPSTAYPVGVAYTGTATTTQPSTGGNETRAANTSVSLWMRLG